MGVNKPMTILNVLDYGVSQNSPDNTDNFQRALDATKDGDTVLVPPCDRPYLMNALRGLRPKSSTSIIINGTIKSLPNDQDHSTIFLTQGQIGVSFSGTGALIGDRSIQDAAPEISHAFGIAVFDSSNVSITDLRIFGCAGDGVYLQGNKDVIVNNVLSSGHKRNGISVISGENYRITNNVLSMMNGPKPLPGCGIDLEPDLPSQGLVNVYVTQNKFIKNKGAGCYVAFSPAANRRNVHVVNNYFDQHYKDGSGPPMGGLNTPLCNFFYATCRALPGYDYWFWPTSYDLA